jgi:hypothetical protein
VLLYKIKKNLPHEYYKILKSYLNERVFQVKLKEVITNLRKIEAGVPQGSVLGPVPYLIYPADLPTSEDTNTATFADDTAILALDDQPETATAKLQNGINNLEQWTKKWKIEVNQNKSEHITFTTRNLTCLTVQMNNVALPQVNQVKYIGMHLHRRLTWAKRVKMKRKQLNLTNY